MLGEDMDYKYKLGMKCGLEVHQQLATKHKLFCNCSAAFKDKEPMFEVVRKLRPVAGELGDIDVAASFESLKDKIFRYKVYLNETCAVELDCEPPHSVNREALEIALQVALMLKCQIPEEIEVMRKIVLDGSAVSSFQRTMLVGLNGSVKTSFGEVGITNICLEEDAAQIIKRDKKSTVYGLNRLGIPLVEIGTDSSISSPEEAREVAEKIGMILKSTGKVKSGLGTIRQDLNVSIRGGARVEIKGVQSLSTIPELIKNEIKRQQSIIKRGKRVSKEVRRALPNGKTEFLRPLPGASRLYPETDLPPVVIDEKLLYRIKKNIPELISDKEKRIKEKFNLNKEILKQLKKAERLDLFEKLSKTYDVKTVSLVLTSLMKQLNADGINTKNITDERIEELFQFLKNKPLPKEGIIDLMKQMAENPSKKVEELASDKEVMSEKEVRRIVKKIISERNNILKQYNAEKIFMGLIMKEIRGRASGATIMKILREEMKG